jgi:SAM-dependent methyltransferase
MDPIPDALAKINGGRVLDIATGRGNFIGLLLQYLPGITGLIGIDTNEAPLKAAGEKIKDERVSFQRMDAGCMEFPDSSFDTVAISYSLHHMADLSDVLGEIVRVLKPGGTLIVSEMYCDGVQAETQVTHVELHHWWGAVDTARGIYHANTYPRQQIVDILYGIGLCDIHMFDDADLTSDPKDPDLAQELIRTIENYQARLKDLPDETTLHQRGVELRERVLKVGFHSASVLFAIGKKPG